MIEEAVGSEDNVRLPFRLVVESAHLAGRATTIVAGRWEQGTFYPGDCFELAQACDGEQMRRQVRATSIDAYRTVDRDPALGMLFGVVVEGVAPADVRAGDVLQAVEGAGSPPAPEATAGRPGRRMPQALRRFFSAI